MVLDHILPQGLQALVHSIAQAPHCFAKRMTSSRIRAHEATHAGSRRAEAEMSKTIALPDAV